jgi:hypothetical protein
MWKVKIAYPLVCNMRKVYTRPASASDFYLPHMEYEGSIDVVSRKMTFFCMSRAGAVAVERKICATIDHRP